MTYRQIAALERAIQRYIYKDRINDKGIVPPEIDDKGNAIFYHGTKATGPFGKRFAKSVYLSSDAPYARRYADNPENWANVEQGVARMFRVRIPQERAAQLWHPSADFDDQLDQEWDDETMSPLGKHLAQGAFFAMENPIQYYLPSDDSIAHLNKWDLEQGHKPRYGHLTNLSYELEEMPQDEWPEPRPDLTENELRCIAKQLRLIYALKREYGD